MFSVPKTLLALEKATPKHDPREVLKCVQFAKNNTGMVATATDAKFLLAAHWPLLEGEEAPETPILIHRDTLQDAKKALARSPLPFALVQPRGDTVEVQAGSAEFKQEAVDLLFPDTERMLNRREGTDPEYRIAFSPFVLRRLCDAVIAAGALKDNGGYFSPPSLVFSFYGAGAAVPFAVRGVKSDSDVRLDGIVMPVSLREEDQLCKETEEALPATA